MDAGDGERRRGDVPHPCQVSCHAVHHLARRLARHLPDTPPSPEELPRGAGPGGSVAVFGPAG
ncbi:hypothetical protein GCM10027519_26870 [Kineococcus endophyticus]